MGFNVGGFLNAVGDVFSTGAGGPVGLAVGAAAKVAAGAISSPPGRATTPPAQISPPQTQTGPVSAQNVSRGFTPAPFRGGGQRFGFGIPTSNVASLAPAARIGGQLGLGAIGGGIARMFGGNGGQVSEILKEARENVQGPVTKNRIIDAAKFCGIEQAADTYGLSQSQVCLVIVSGRTRRRRGISAANIRDTKRVIRFNKRLTKDLRTR